MTVHCFVVFIYTSQIPVLSFSNCSHARAFMKLSANISVVRQYSSAMVNCFADEVVTDLHVFCPLMEDWNFSHGYSSLAILIDDPTSPGLLRFTVDPSAD